MTRLTDDQIEEAFDAIGYFVGAEDITVGDEAEFDRLVAARKEWALPGTIKQKDATVLWILGAQAFKGQSRREIIAIKHQGFCLIFGYDK